jgi:hypothetical protein
MSSWEENYDWIQDIYRAINPGLPEPLGGFVTEKIFSCCNYSQQ